MKLSRAFKSNTSLFRQAIAEDDTDLMARLLTRKMDIAFVFDMHSKETFAALTPKMASFLAQNVSPEVERRWDDYGIRSVGGGTLLSAIYHSTLYGRPEKVLAEAFMAGYLTPQQLAVGIITHIKDADDRLSLFQRVIGHDLAALENPEFIVDKLRTCEMAPEFDVLVAAGYAPHKDNEALLRKAAENENRRFALHLVAAHQADIDLAINTARFAGQDKVCDLLSDLRRETHPNAAPLQTFEEMAQELTMLRRTVKTLEKTVADLAGKVAALESPAAKLDKTPLRKQP